ncbi:MAG: cardiolipin synthase [Firmicutes bacterium]|nr:cardiolipin synthase [Bacillota bacterium]
MKKISSILFHRVFFIALALVVQVAALILMIGRFSNYFPELYGLTTALSAVAVLAIASGTNKPTYKIAWMIPIVFFPIFGMIFYFLLGSNRTSKRLTEKINQIDQRTTSFLTANKALLEELSKHDKQAGRQARYIQEQAGFPLYRHNFSQFYPLGELKFLEMKKELSKAQKYIFMEYFIITKGVMWDSILEILAEKAKQGVDVRLIYDDAGCILTLPHGYDRKLEALGIKTARFHPIVPVISPRLNNRDHRKLTVIDGHTGFTGGINLADEYINAFEKHGHWKDSGILIKGEAVWPLTTMFLAMWEYLTDTTEDYEQFRPVPPVQAAASEKAFIQPFGDSPFGREAVGETVYLNLINRAEDYIYINTPYLILEGEMITALCLAAKSGVDVRIVTPHIADKPFVHAVTRSYYQTLLKSGVRIYEYTPGFMHSKTFVADDKVAVVGTINLDYRSLYLHFENGVWLYKTESVLQIKDDFVQTLEFCLEMTVDLYYNLPAYKKMKRSVLRLFAPLL